MNIPAGSICEIILSNDSNESIKGVLAEGVSINLQSSYKTLVSDNDVTDNGTVDLVGEALRSVSGGKAGFSSKMKQYTTQVWDKTNPAAFSLSVDFSRVPMTMDDDTEITGKSVIEFVRKACSVPLPKELAGKTGNLTPPGPSVIEGIGFTADGDVNSKAHGIVTVKLGSMSFSKLIMKSAEPTFSQYVDDSGYPISCKIQFTFETMWAATEQAVQDEWWAI